MEWLKKSEICSCVCLMSLKVGVTNLPGLKRSIRRTITSKARRKINSESEATASPSLPTKRKRTSSLTEETGPAPKKMAAEQDILNALAGLQASMVELKQKVDSIPTREDFTKIETSVGSIRREVAANTERLDGLSKKQEDEERDFVRNVERVIDKRMAYHKTTRSGVLALTADEADKEKQFLLARRTMMLWPVNLVETGNAVRHFIETTLEVPSQITKALNIVQIERIQQARRSRVQDEVKVVFATSRERDLVQSYAANLAKHEGKAGIRMDIPEHLRGLFKLYEAHGANLRQRFPGLRRSIKFDDTSQSLCMDVRMPEKQKWHRISEPEMREITRRNSNRPGSSGVSETGEDERDRRRILGLGRDPEADIPVVGAESSEES